MAKDWLTIIVFLLGLLFSIVNSENKKHDFKRSVLNDPAPENSIVNVKNVFNPNPSSQTTEARLVFAYRSYRDVQFLHYKVPELTSLAVFQYYSNGTKSGQCPPKKIIVHLQLGGYPVVNPDNSTYPPMVSYERKYSMMVELFSDDKPVTLNVTVPIPGDWFAIAYISEDTNRIVQKGLFTTCQAWLHSHAKYYSEKAVSTLTPGVSVSQLVMRKFYYRYLSPSNVWSARISISKCSFNPSISNCPIVMYARSEALPDSENYDNLVNCSENITESTCQLEVIPSEGSWSFIFVTVPTNVTVEFDIAVELVGCQNQMEHLTAVVADVPQFSSGNMPKFLKPIKTVKKVKDSLPVPEGFRSSVVPWSLSCWPQIPLIRNNQPGNFEFRFDQLPDVNGTTSVALNLSSNSMTLFKFDFQAVLDSGGTLAVELVLSPLQNTSSENVTVNACLQNSLRPSISINGKCQSNYSLSINSSSEKNKVGALLIPFPQAGKWFLSLETHCYDQESNESDPIPIDCQENITSIFFQIKSTPCILGQCGRYGNCYQYISGGFIFSTCICEAGWKGWGCTDGSGALPNSKLLLAMLLLTLSNIFFLPAIVLAVYRRYFTEALVFMATMVFSTLYHACDSEVFTFCLIRSSVLQYCDFYSAILSIWVTLLAMADLPPTLLSLAHMAGAVGVALGVEYDRTGLWVFAIPAGLGFLILLVSWFHHCRIHHNCYPRKRIWCTCLLPGVLIAACGLSLFAFLETRSNYAFVHSGWHAAMALSILFLLPERREVKEVVTCSQGCRYS